MSRIFVTEPGYTLYMPLSAFSQKCVITFLEYIKFPFKPKLIFSLTLYLVPVLYGAMTRHGDRNKKDALRKKFIFMDIKVNKEEKKCKV